MTDQDSQFPEWKDSPATPPQLGALAALELTIKLLVEAPYPLHKAHEIVGALTFLESIKLQLIQSAPEAKSNG